MSSIKITFPDNSVKEFDAGVTTAEIAKSISISLAKKAVAGKVDGNFVDYEQTYTVESETGDPSYEDMVEAQTIAEDHGCKEYMLTELD